MRPAALSQRGFQALLVVAFGIPGVVLIGLVWGAGSAALGWMLAAALVVAGAAAIWWRVPWEWIRRALLIWLWLTAAVGLALWVAGSRSVQPLVSSAVMFGALWTGLLLLPVSFVAVLAKRLET